MTLEQVVERIRRVDPGDRPFFGNTGRSLEWQTRYYMVDPLLRALGWDTGCPQEVRVEWPVPSGGRVDYALFAPDNRNHPQHLHVPKALIEVKRRRANLPVELSGQIAGYVRGWPDMAGIAVMTNGMLWHFYEVRGGVVHTQEPADTIDLSLGSATVAAEKIYGWLNRDKWPR